MNAEDLFQRAIHEARIYLYKAEEGLIKCNTNQSTYPNDYTHAGHMLRIKDAIQDLCTLIYKEVDEGETI